MELALLDHGYCCDHSSAFILIGSSSFLQVTRSTIKAYMGSKFGQTRLGTEELPALERLKNPHRLIMG